MSLWQTVKKWRTCPAFDRVQKITNQSHLAGNLPLLRSSSGRDGSLHSFRDPDYLIPLAYRKQNPGQDERKNVCGKSKSNLVIDAKRGGQSSQHSPRPYHPKGRANIKSQILQKNREKSSFGQRGSSTGRKSPSFSLDNNGGDISSYIENIRDVENMLSLRMNDYLNQMSGFSSHGFNAHAEKTTISGTAESTLTHMLGSINSMDYLDNSLQKNGPHPSSLYDTEESYEKIVSDFKTIIIGWSEVAESICTAKQTENSFRRSKSITLDGVPPESVIFVSDYEDAVLRAERYLERFEALYYNHVNVISAEKSILEENKEMEEAGQASIKKVMWKILSSLRDFVSNSTSATTNNFDQSWKGANGKEKSFGSRKPEMTLSNFENTIKPQKYRDWNLSLFYEHVLLANHSSYCFGREARDGSAQRSNRLLNRWISLYCFSQPNSAAVENCDTRNESSHIEEAAERKLFHAVIRQNVDLFSVDGVQRAKDWLSRMRYLKKMGKVNCAPDVDTYNLILLGFCNLSKSFRHNRCDLANRGTESRNDEIMTRQFIVDGVESVLLEITEFKDEGLSPNRRSLNLAVNAIAKAGRNFPDATLQKTNRLLFNILGEQKYRSIFVDLKSKNYETTILNNRDSISSQFSENEIGDKHCVQSERYTMLDTYHWVVDIFSASGNIAYIKQGMTLLRNMIHIRIEQDSGHLIHKNGSRNTPASFAPSTGTHNNVLRALVEKVNDLSRMKTCGNVSMHDGDRSATAKEVTDFLDSMVKYGSSFPTPVTFLFMLQIWQKTRSPEAGVYAEEILSRMEIVGTYQNESKPFPHAYVLALECWFTAAKAGRSGSAECAFRILELMEAQYGRDCSFSGSQTENDEVQYGGAFDKSMFPHIRMYPLMMNICAATHEKHDTSRAMAIAFEVYDKMIHSRIKPSPRTFEMMYICVRNFLDHHPEEERQGLLQKVYEPASKHGITRGELMGRHKQLLRKGSLVA